MKEAQCLINVTIHCHPVTRARNSPGLIFFFFFWVGNKGSEAKTHISKIQTLHLKQHHHSLKAVEEQHIPQNVLWGVQLSVVFLRSLQLEGNRKEHQEVFPTSYRLKFRFNFYLLNSFTGMRIFNGKEAYLTWSYLSKVPFCVQMKEKSKTDNSMPRILKIPHVTGTHQVLA